MLEDVRAYQVSELGPVRNGIQANEIVADFNSLETHHPKSNRHLHMQDGDVIGGENPRPPRVATRSHAFIGGEYQEIMDASVDKYHSLKPDQVLLIKDFILDDPAPSPGTSSRNVDVPAPVAGYVGRVDANNGVVDLYDRKEGDVVARIRHLGPIAVEVGDEVTYGQSLGAQNRIGLPPYAGKHVHLEMDTRYYQQFENYIADLASGRLPVQAGHRVGIQPQAVVDDGVMRLGESGERVATVQRALIADGYRGVGDKPIQADGVYRPGMQGAVLAFQQDHRIPQTGDIDPATYQLALRVNIDQPLGPAQPQPSAPDYAGLPQSMRDIARGLDPVYTPKPGEPAPNNGHPADPARTGRTPDHHGHPDHDPAPMMTAPNPGSPGRGRRTPEDPGHPDHALLQQIREGVRAIDLQNGRSYDDTSERISRSLLAHCKDQGEAPDRTRVLGRVDHVLLGTNAQNIFAVEGRLDDPAHCRVHLTLAQAAQTPVEQSDQKLEAANQQIARQQAQEPVFAQQHEQTQQAPGMQGAPVMRV